MSDLDGFNESALESSFGVSSECTRCLDYSAWSPRGFPLLSLCSCLSSACLVGCFRDLACLYFFPVMTGDKKFLEKDLL